MLRRVSIDNFKSLADFELPASKEKSLGKFVCLVGLNGAGKTTVLQALDFLAHLALGDVAAWLRSREWEAAELKTKRGNKSNIRFSVEIESALGGLTWSGVFNIGEGRCTAESLVLEADDAGKEIFSERTTLRFDSSSVVFSDGSRVPLITEHEGSALGSIKLDNVGLKDRLLVVLFKHYMSGVKSLELLSPNVMRRPSRDAVDVGVGGEKLAAFIRGLSSDERSSLIDKLSEFYPRLKKVHAKTGKYGWTRLYFVEGEADPLEIEAKHVNDGLLRVTAIVAQTVAQGGYIKSAKAQTEALSKVELQELGSLDQKRYQYVLLEEIENGINPDLIERLIGYLQAVPQQVFVTTHSPLVLNYLSDDVARDAVFITYRGKGGRVKVRRLFEVEGISKKLEFMGPGEAYADTALEQLTAHLAQESTEP